MFKLSRFIKNRKINRRGEVATEIKRQFAEEMDGIPVLALQWSELGPAGAPGHYCMVLDSEDHLRYITIENRAIAEQSKRHAPPDDDLMASQTSYPTKGMKKSMSEFLRKIDVGDISFISTNLTGALKDKRESYDIKLYGRLTKVRLAPPEAGDKGAESGPIASS